LSPGFAERLVFAGIAVTESAELAIAGKKFGNNNAVKMITDKFFLVIFYLIL
jgi:hypothetical protein